MALRRIDIRPRPVTAFKELLEEIRKQTEAAQELSRQMDDYRRGQARELAAEMSDGNDEYVPGPSCDDNDCAECRDENCPCRCHTNHERFDLPENEFPTMTDTGIEED